MVESGEVESSGGNAEVPNETVVVHVPRVTARTFPGPASPQNKGAIDWYATRVRPGKKHVSIDKRLCQ